MCCVVAVAAAVLHWFNVFYTRCFNSRPCSTFCYLRQWRGVGMTPWRFQTKRWSVSQQRPTEWARRVLAIGVIFFALRSIFDQVMAGQRSVLGKINVFFFTSRGNSDAVIVYIAMNPLPSFLFIALVRFLSLHNPRKIARSRPPRSVGGGQPAASGYGSSLLLALS